VGGNLGKRTTGRQGTWAALWPLLNSIDELKAELAKGTDSGVKIKIKKKTESSDGV